MKHDRRRRVPAWRVSETRSVPPQVVLGAVAILGALLLEVWQSAAVASLSVQLGRATHALQQAHADLEWSRAQLERSSSRVELAPVAAALGLRPVDPQHIVTLPEDYLEPAEVRPGGTPSLLASAGRVLQSLVPEASARGRRVN